MRKCVEWLLIQVCDVKSVSIEKGDNIYSSCLYYNKKGDNILKCHIYSNELEGVQ